MAFTTNSGRTVYRVHPGLYTTEMQGMDYRGDIIERSYDGKSWLVWHRHYDHTLPTPRFRTLREAVRTLA